jgi:hypothetical protein
MRRIIPTESYDKAYMYSKKTVDYYFSRRDDCSDPDIRSSTHEKVTTSSRKWHLIKQFTSNCYHSFKKKLQSCSSMRRAFCNTLCKLLVMFLFYGSQLILILFQIITITSKSVLSILWACCLFVFQCCTAIFRAKGYVGVRTVIIIISTLSKIVIRRFVF